MTDTNAKPLMLARTSDETESEALARASVGPDVGAALALTALNDRAQCYGDTDPTALRAELARVTADGAETGTDRLLTQAIVLDRLFAYFTTAAVQRESIHATAIYLKLALRAQAQSRATLQTVSDIRHPRMYVNTQHVGEQYNAAGHQQVNRDGADGREQDHGAESAHVDEKRPTGVSDMSGAEP